MVDLDYPYGSKSLLSWTIASTWTCLAEGQERPAPREIWGDDTRRPDAYTGRRNLTVEAGPRMAFSCPRRITLTAPESDTYKTMGKAKAAAWTTRRGRQRVAVGVWLGEKAKAVRVEVGRVWTHFG